MENATKALEIAAGVFFGLLILGALVLAYNRVAELRRTQYGVERDQQTTEFNKSYEAYNTDSVYGSELFSLANKVNDYNKKYTADDGYEELKLSVKFKKDYGDYFSKNKTKYSAEEMKKQYNQLANAIKTNGNEKLTATNGEKKTVQEWSKVSNTTIRTYFNTSSNEYKKITEYKQLTVLQNDIVRTSFKCTGYEYDTNGRITEMKFEEKDS